MLFSVAKAFRDKFAEAADSRDPYLFAADFEHVSVDVHIPVLDIPNLPVKEAPRHLVRAVIQGKFEIERRDYVRIFQELIESLNGMLRPPEANGKLTSTNVCRESSSVGIPPTRGSYRIRA